MLALNEGLNKCCSLFSYLPYKVLKKLWVLCQCYIKKKSPHKHQILYFKMGIILFKEVIMVELGKKWEISWRQWRWLKGMGRDAFTQIKWHCAKYLRKPLGLPTESHHSCLNLTNVSHFYSLRVYFIFEST